MVRDGEIAHPASLCAPGHLLDRVPAIRVHGVAVHEATDILSPHQVGRQGSGEPGLDLAGVLPQLRRDLGQSQLAIELLLPADTQRARAPVKAVGVET